MHQQVAGNGPACKHRGQRSAGKISTQILINKQPQTNNVKTTRVQYVTHLTPVSCLKAAGALRQSCDMAIAGHHLNKPVALAAMQGGVCTKG